MKKTNSTDSLKHFSLNGNSEENNDLTGEQFRENIFSLELPSTELKGNYPHSPLSAFHIPFRPDLPADILVFYICDKDENPLVANGIVFNAFKIIIKCISNQSGQSSDIMNLL